MELVHVTKKHRVLRYRSNCVLQTNQSLTVACFLGKSKLKTVRLGLRYCKDCKSSVVIAVRHNLSTSE